MWSRCCWPMLGVAILFGAEIGHQGPNAWLGGGLIFAGAFIYAIYVTASKPIITKMGSNAVHGVRHVGRLHRVPDAERNRDGAPCAAAGDGERLLAGADARDLLHGHSVFHDRRCDWADIGPGPTSAVGGVGPVVAAWAAVMILHEPFGWPHMVAMVLTIVGVWMLAKPRITRSAGTRTW
jgi:hypothetical protein